MSRFTTPPLSLRRQISRNEQHGIRDTTLYPIVSGRNTSRHKPRNYNRDIETNETIEEIVDILPNAIDGVENKKLLDIMTKIIGSIMSNNRTTKSEDPEMESEEPEIESNDIEMENDEPEQETEEVQTLYDIATTAFKKGKDIYDIYERFVNVSSGIQKLGSVAMDFLRPMYKQSFMRGGSLREERIHIDNYNRFHTNHYGTILPTDLQIGMRDRRNIKDITNTRRRN
tara:strand:- start:404 stop:1087 length:684 start_codon:yes stop_codon:yes gene_type:complete